MFSCLFLFVMGVDTFCLLWRVAAFGKSDASWAGWLDSGGLLDPLILAQGVQGGLRGKGGQKRYHGRLYLHFT